MTMRSWVWVFLSLAWGTAGFGEDPAFLSVGHASNQASFIWTPAGSRCVVEQADALLQPYRFVSAVSTAGAVSVAATNVLSFYRLEAVNTGLFLDRTLENTVREALITDGLKLSPPDLVYDVELRSLTGLTAAYLDLTNLTGLSYASGLQVLVLDGNQIADFSPIRNLRNLQELRAYGNPPEGLWYFTNLTQLTTLDVGRCGLSDLSLLSTLTNLTVLYADDNFLTHCSGLESMKQLNEFYASGNQISDLSAMTGATGLVRLLLPDNQITNVQALVGLLALGSVDLGNNTGVTNIQPLIQNAAAGGLGTGDVVSILGNTGIPVFQIQSLTNFGVEVIGP